MKKTLAMILSLVLAMAVLSSCAGKAPAQSPASSGSPTPSTSASPAVNLPAQSGAKPAASAPPSSNPSPQAAKSNLYDPSIFVIQAKGSWKQELAPGYYANYECEMYLDKVDSNDNRVATGTYSGAFWMKVTIDAGEYISNLLQNAPVSAQFNAGGEGLSENLAIHLLDGYKRDPLQSYDIPVKDGSAITPAKDALADKGSFVLPGMGAYLNATAQGAGGASLNYSDNKTSDTDINYIIQVAPDPTGSATERKVTIYLTTAGGAPVTFEGTWTRLPGYPEDVLKYANSGKQNELVAAHKK